MSPACATCYCVRVVNEGVSWGRLFPTGGMETSNGLQNKSEGFKFKNTLLGGEFKVRGVVVHRRKTSQHVKTSQYLEKIITNKIKTINTF